MYSHSEYFCFARPSCTCTCSVMFTCILTNRLKQQVLATMTLRCHHIQSPSVMKNLKSGIRHTVCTFMCPSLILSTYYSHMYTHTHMYTLAYNRPREFLSPRRTGLLESIITAPLTIARYVGRPVPLSFECPAFHLHYVLCTDHFHNCDPLSP